MAYKKISGLTAGAAIVGTDTFEAVQSSESVYVTAAQMATYVYSTTPPAGVSNTTVITGEYQFTEDNELDYASSISDGTMNSAVVFTELPATTKAIHAYVGLADTSTSPALNWQRSTGGSQIFNIRGVWADGGTNEIYAPYWMPTNGNSIYMTTVVADTGIIFRIIGYKTGA